MKYSERCGNALRLHSRQAMQDYPGAQLACQDLMCGRCGATAAQNELDRTRFSAARGSILEGGTSYAAYIGPSPPIAEYKPAGAPLSTS